MTGKKLVKNLLYYLDPFTTVDTYPFDQHTDITIPRLVVGYDSESPSFPGDHGHYSVGGYVDVVYQGREDSLSEDADSTAQVVIDALCDRTALETSLNKPLSGADARPLSAFGLNQLFIRGVTRDITDHSTTIQIRFDAFCIAKDKT